MKINWKVRAKNPYFWFGLVAIVLAAVGAKPEMFTSWSILIMQVKSLLSNPFALGCVIVAIVGYINDPTTEGITDSKQALSYNKPKKDWAIIPITNNNNEKIKKIGGKYIMKKIAMVSQTMGGKTEEEILQTREKAVGDVVEYIKDNVA